MPFSFSSRYCRLFGHNDFRAIYPYLIQLNKKNIFVNIDEIRKWSEDSLDVDLRRLFLLITFPLVICSRHVIGRLLWHLLRFLLIVIIITSRERKPEISRKTLFFFLLFLENPARLNAGRERPQTTTNRGL